MAFHETQATNHETRLFTRRASQREFRAFHETRDTRHESRLFFETRITKHETRLFFELPPCPELLTIARHCPPLPGSPGAAWQPRHRLHGCIPSPRNRPFPGNKSLLQQIPPESHGPTACLLRRFCLGVTRHESRPLPGARRKPARIPRFSRNTKHETRNTAFYRDTRHESRDTRHETRLFPPFPPP